MQGEVDELHERVKRAELTLAQEQKQQEQKESGFTMLAQSQKDLDQLRLLHQNAALELAAMSEASSRTRGMPYVCIWCDLFRKGLVLQTASLVLVASSFLVALKTTWNGVQGLKGITRNSKLSHAEANQLFKKRKSRGQLQVILTLYVQVCTFK